VAKSRDELERLAELTADLDLQVSEDSRRFWELVKSLTREDVLELAEIHARRARELG
jgi:hypothetical protein